MSSFFNKMVEGATKLAQNDLVQNFAEQVITDPKTKQALDDLGLDKVIAGLKEALKVGIQTAVQLIGKENGFLLNQAIKIGMPPQVQPILKGVLQVPGTDGLVKKISDEFEASMNHAAEKAVPLGLDIFFAALEAIQFDDVKRIWKGEDLQAATKYFEQVCTPQLQEAFGPIIKQQVEANQVTRKYDQMMDTLLKLPVVKNIPFLESILKVEIDQYTLEKGLKGLFTMIGEQEAKIRSDPQYRTSDLLQQVFK